MKRLFKYILALMVAAYLPSCGGGEHDHDHEHEGHSHEAEEAHEHEHEHNHGEGTDEIILEPEMAERMGVTTAVLQPSQFSEVIEVSGQILPAPGDIAVAVAPTSGVVTFAPGVAPGMQITSGARIAGISAKGMSGGDTNHQAQVAIEAARRELDRAKPLREQGLITVQEYNEILARYEAAVAAYSPKAASGSVTSPIAGVLTNLMVRQGEYVETGQPIAQISRTQRLTLRADLPERYTAFLPTVTSANFRAAGAEDFTALADLGGQLSSGTSMATSQDGYFPIYFTFNNDGSAPAGVYVDVALLGAQRAGVLTVPVTAITEQQGEKYVYVKIDDEGYERRLVKTGGSDGLRVEIISGLEKGDNVVTKGATVIRLAENSGKIPEGHSHQH